MNRAVCGKTQTARFFRLGMDKGKSEQHAEEVRKSDQLNRAEGSRGDSPLQGQGTASLVGFGATPQPFLVKPTQRKKSTRRRQRSVPASNFALPQERSQAAHSTTHILSRQMGATDQYGKRFVFPMLVFFVARGFASAEASRGLCGRPRHPFALHFHVS